MYTHTFVHFRAVVVFVVVIIIVVIIIIIICSIIFVIITGLLNILSECVRIQNTIIRQRTKGAGIAEYVNKGRGTQLKYNAKDEPLEGKITKVERPTCRWRGDIVGQQGASNMDKDSKG